MRAILIKHSQTQDPCLIVELTLAIDLAVASGYDGRVGETHGQGSDAALWNGEAFPRADAASLACSAILGNMVRLGASSTSKVG